MRAGLARQAARALMLPTRVGHESRCCLVFGRHLIRSGIPIVDFAAWVRLQLEQWEDTKKPSVELRVLVRVVLDANSLGKTTDSVTKRLAVSYFEIHQKLLDDHLMSHADAASFLSYAFIFAEFAKTHKMSSAQIANQLTSRKLLSNGGRQAIACVLEKLDACQTIKIDDLRTLYHRDAANEISTFADADFTEAAELVAEKAISLGYRGDLLQALTELSPAFNFNRFTDEYTPYLQILHYQCCIAEFIDHAVTDIYEFAPRGEKGEWLRKQYPDGIAGAGNPFLNNAKAVEVLDRGWARSKKPKERIGATALLLVLEELQEMSFFSRRELAFWIRSWLHRIIRVCGGSTLVIPKSLSKTNMLNLLQKTAKCNTQSYGVIEQRLVDVVGSTIFPKLRSHGLGDAVNATNTSKAKFGDCEFFDPINRVIHAYESHAGKLSQLYVEDHLASIKKVIRKRRTELSQIAEISDWRVELIFVSHEISGVVDKKISVDGLCFAITAISFESFFRTHSSEANKLLLGAAVTHLLTPLSQYRTPNLVRARLLELI